MKTSFIEIKGVDVEREREGERENSRGTHSA
jgi:hypothetical protein